MSFLLSMFTPHLINVKVPMTTRSRKGSKQPKLGSDEVTFIDIFSQKHHNLWLSRLKPVLCTTVLWRNRTAIGWLRVSVTGNKENVFKNYFQVLHTQSLSLLDDWCVFVINLKWISSQGSRARLWARQVRERSQPDPGDIVPRNLTVSSG